MTNKGVLKIADKPLERMISFKQDQDEKPEAGGVLLGRLMLDSKNIIIDKVTIPLIGDKRSRYSYIRHEKGHQRIITSCWKKSGGTCNYLGEWHTHPERYPNPSQQDISNWKKILETRIFYTQYLFFIIVGTKEVRVWEGRRRTKKIKRLY